MCAPDKKAQHAAATHRVIVGMPFVAELLPRQRRPAALALHRKPESREVIHAPESGAALFLLPFDRMVPGAGG